MYTYGYDVGMSRTGQGRQVGARTLYGASVSGADKRAIEGSAAGVYAQMSQGESGSAGEPAQMISDLLTALSISPWGKSRQAYLSKDLHAQSHPKEGATS